MIIAIVDNEFLDFFAIVVGGGSTWIGDGLWGGTKILLSSTNWLVTLIALPIS